jgi:acyl transferase domain-containing protein/thioesterase domain-containing protein
VAGALSLDDAAAVVALRSRAITALVGKGGMAAVELPADQLARRLEPFGERLSIAAVNSPRATVVSGQPDALDALLAQLAAEQVFARKVRVDYASHSAQIDALEPDLRRRLAGLAPRPPDIPFYSTVTGQLLDQPLDADYWFRNLRRTVRFADAADALLARGHRFFVEVSPHPVLTLPLEQLLEHAAVPGAVVPSLRRDQAGLDRLLLSLGQLHAGGLDVDWTAALPPGRAVPLPTYPFQRESYWLDPPRAQRADVASAGLAPAEHPLLGAVVTVAGADQILLTGRLSLDSQPWLADHAVLGAVLVPGTALLDLALAAGARVELPCVDELTLEAPLLLSPVDPAEPAGDVELQLTVGPPDPAGARSVAIHTRPAGAPAGADWTRHATGALRVPDPAPPLDLGAWPPPGAIPIDLDGLYQRLADRGLVYGPAFRGLVAAWRRGDQLFVESRLPGDGASAGDAGRFAIHPAVLDAALHALALAAPERPGDLALPFSWTGVRWHGPPAGPALRVRLSPGPVPGAISLAIADGAGAPVGSVEALVLRPASQEQLRAAAAPAGRALYRLDWTAPTASPAALPERWAILTGGDPDGDPDGDQDDDEDGDQGGDSGGDPRHVGCPADPAAALVAALVAAGFTVDHRASAAELRRATDTARAHAAPEVVLVLCDSPAGRGAGPDTGSSTDTARLAHAAARRALSVLRDWLLAEDSSTDGDARRLVLLTRRAVAAGPDEDVLDLVHAPVWGLVRSAQLEHPERSIVLVDLDEDLASWRALPHALACGEPQVALRRGRALVPRLVHAAPGPAGAIPARFDPAGTVLVTGGSGTLAGLVARHLVTRHGAARVLLASRRGPAAPGADDLRRELTAAGADVALAACDVTDRAELERLLASIPREHPLTAVVHAAGVLDDGSLLSMDPERLRRVLAPKLDAALHLHELTRERDLSAFILFSSLSGVAGSPGQGNYAAANAFLDALAHHRRSRGLPTVSLAWGYWEERTGMTAHLSDDDVARMSRAGVRPLSSRDGLELFDAAVARSEACLVPARLDAARLRGAEAAPPLFRRLIRAAPPLTAPTARPALLRLDPDRRRAALLQLLRDEAAAELGLGGARDVPVDRSLLELGLNSLMAIAIRRRLSQRLAAPVPATLLLDAPTVDAAADRLAEVFASSAGADPRRDDAGAAPPGAAPPGTAPDAGPAAGHTRPAGATAPVDDTPSRPAGRLASLYRDAVAAGHRDLGHELLDIAARMRPTFESLPGAGAPGPAPLRLARGAARPALVCVPSLAVPTGAVQWSRFAAALQHLRDVSVLPMPGYVDGEPLPASPGAAVRALSDAVRRCAPCEGLAIAGLSSGGWLAHAIASHLESQGESPAAVVLIDTYLPARTPPELMSAFQGAWMNFQSALERRDEELTAMAWYFRLFAGWAPAPLAAPLLFVRSSEPLAGAGPDWRAAWDQPHALVDAPGDHFTLMGEHAAAAARAVHDWLAALPRPIPIDRESTPAPPLDGRMRTTRRGGKR